MENPFKILNVLSYWQDKIKTPSWALNTIFFSLPFLSHPLSQLRWLLMIPQTTTTGVMPTHNSSP